MASLLSIDRVQYECSCGSWSSVNRLYFCRHCSELKCNLCVSEEMATLFCPSCLDNVSTGEAKQKKNRCSNCFQCPVCGVGLVVRAANETYHLLCNSCRWTTADSDIPDSTSSTNWPEYTFGDTSLLNAFLERMRSYASIEKADRERQKYTKRRSNLGVLSDRFGLQAMYNRRRALLTEQSTVKYPVLSAIGEFPDLDESVFTEKVDVGAVPTLMQQIRQPLANGRPLLPIRTPLCSRRSIRCKQCDHSLCKGEYSPTSIKFKIQVLGGTYVPVVRLSRLDALIPNQWCPLFLTISNCSTTHAQVVITADNKDSDDFHVKCDSQVIELTIPNQDDTMEWDEMKDKQHIDSDGCVVFRRRNRVGIRFNVMATEGNKKCLALILKHRNSSNSFEIGGEKIWLQHRINVDLGSTISSSD